MECKKCNRETTVSNTTGSECSHCKIVYCRNCDDSSQYLQWWGTDPKDRDGTDLYLCEPCLGKHSGIVKAKKIKKSKPERVEEKPAIEGNVYIHTPIAPSS